MSSGNGIVEPADNTIMVLTVTNILVQSYQQQLLTAAMMNSK